MQQKFTPNPGDTVYSPDGSAGLFVGRLDGRNFVVPEYIDDEYPDEPSYGKIETWPAVFANPPKNVLDEETAKAKERLDELTAQIASKRREFNDIDREFSERLERIKQHEALADLDRYLSGQITHYIATSQYNEFSIEIIPVGVTVDNYSDPNEYGMLKLKPSKNHQSATGLRWNVVWKVPSPNYSRNSDVIPCCGLEEAQAKSRAMITERITAKLASGSISESDAIRMADACKTHGITPPDKAVEIVNQWRRQRLEKELAAANEKAAQAQALAQELAALTPSTNQEKAA